MKINEKKLARQLKFIDKWKPAKAGTLEAVTGFGKTYVGILLLLEMNQKRPDRIAIVVVPRIPLKKQWEALIKAHGIKNTTIFVINTAVKVPRTCDLLILDEVHNYAAPSFIKVMKSIKRKFLLGLTATLERNDQRHNLLKHVCPILDTVTMEEALREGYVSSFSIYNLGIELNEREQRLYNDVDEKFKKFFRVFGNDFHLAMQCSIDPVMRNMYANRMKMDPDYVNLAAINFGRYMNLRKRIVYSLDSKAEAILKLIDGLPARKIVIFSETVNFLEKLKKRVTKETGIYHSNMTPKARTKVLKDFVGNKFKILLSARALDEGLDVEDIDCIIVASGSSSKRQDIQRTGRGIRFLEGKDALVINLYAKDTVDLNWLKSRQEKNVPPKWVYSVDAIINPDVTKEQNRSTGFETRFELTD
jgi:superfamily II DNA or RNA helicase